MTSAPETFQYHENRRDGNGSVEAPTARRDHLCAVEHCPEIGRMLRVTKSGYAVLYCAEHERAADRAFG